MKKAAIAALLTLASAVAHADSWFQYEAGVGAAQYNTIGNGTWYQENMPGNKLHLAAPAVSLGVGFRLYEQEYWGVMAHAAYVYLARVSAQCNCTTDANYNLQTKSARDPNGPMGYFSGSGNAQGISLTIEPYVKYAGWHVGVAAGLFVYRPQWDETVRSYYVDGRPFQAAETAHTSNHVQFGRSIGVNVQRGNFGVSFTHYQLPTRYDDSHFPAIYKSADVLMLTYHY